MPICRPAFLDACQSANLLASQPASLRVCQPRLATDTSAILQACLPAIPPTCHAACHFVCLSFRQISMPLTHTPPSLRIYRDARGPACAPTSQPASVPTCRPATLPGWEPTCLPACQLASLATCLRASQPKAYHPASVSCTSLENSKRIPNNTPLELCTLSNIIQRLLRQLPREIPRDSHQNLRHNVAPAKRHLYDEILRRCAGLWV